MTDTRHTQWAESDGTPRSADLTPDDAEALARRIGRRVTQYDEGSRPVLTCEPDGRRMGHS